MDDEDKKLVSLYLEGNVNALEPIIDKYKRPLYSFIIKMTEGKDDADEIFQEVWFRAIKNIHKFKEGKLLSWLFRITHNLIIDRSRKRWRNISINKEVNNESSLTLEEQIASNEIDSEEKIDAKLFGLRIKKALNILSIKQKEVFILRMYEGLSFKEISKIQKCSINTCLARMQYALNKLQNELKDEYNELRGL
tara:strand:- start:1169 stop:1750 length:582 start_codon:yes stop_codon:yes gene_type:complete